MAILEVLKYPDERLRTKAQPITEFNAEVKQLVEDMLETMYAEKGVGLAATQVNAHQQVIVMDLSDERDQPKVFINPSFKSSESKFKNEEGCLSVPGIYAQVERFETGTITAFDAEGKEFSEDASELLAICIQHEMDHLDGILFVDHLSPLKRQRFKAKYEKMQKQAKKQG